MFFRGRFVGQFAEPVESWCLASLAPFIGRSASGDGDAVLALAGSFGDALSLLNGFDRSPLVGRRRVLGVPLLRKVA
jgi:hypothetical protein